MMFCASFVMLQHNILLINGRCDIVIYCIVVVDVEA